MSERLKKIFESSNPKTKLVSYFVGCYPDYKTCLELIKQAIDNGVSIIECGYPTSEASAEGPVIKTAHDKVLENGDTIKDIIKLVREIRDYSNEVGIVMMGYISNLYKYPISEFVKATVLMGKDAALIDQVINSDTPVLHTKTMLEAVVKATELAEPGDFVLLSPACTSLDMFSSFEERGRKFVESVKRVVK